MEMAYGENGANPGNAVDKSLYTCDAVSTDTQIIVTPAKTMETAIADYKTCEVKEVVLRVNDAVAPVNVEENVQKIVDVEENAPIEESISIILPDDVMPVSEYVSDEEKGISKNEVTYEEPVYEEPAKNVVENGSDSIGLGYAESGNGNMRVIKAEEPFTFI